MFDLTAGLNGKFQVMLTEQGEPNCYRFKSAIVQRWRDGQKLIPADWINA